MPDACGVAEWREHRYRGGPPPRRLYRMQLALERRYRLLGLRWEFVDLRLVYAKTDGHCGICGKPVGFEEFTVDHVVPSSKGGEHVLSNLQPAHRSCNVRKGSRV